MVDKREEGSVLSTKKDSLQTENLGEGYRVQTRVADHTTYYSLSMASLLFISDIDCGWRVVSCMCVCLHAARRERDGIAARGQIPKRP